MKKGFSSTIRGLGAVANRDLISDRKILIATFTLKIPFFNVNEILVYSFTNGKALLPSLPL